MPVAITLTTVFSQEFTVVIKLLDAKVITIGDINVTFFVYGYKTGIRAVSLGARQELELAVATALAAPQGNKLAGAVILLNAVIQVVGRTFDFDLSENNWPLAQVVRLFPH